MKSLKGVRFLKIKSWIMFSLILTALGAALELSNLLPGWVSAFLLLAAGGASAYFIALSAKRYETINELSFLAQSGYNLRNCLSGDLAISKLMEAVKSGTGVEGLGYLSPTTADQYLDAKLHRLSEEKIVHKLAKQAAETKSTVFFNSQNEPQGQALLESLNIKEIMAVPVQWQQQMLGTLFLYSNSPIDRNRNEGLAEQLVLYAAEVLYNDQRDQEKQSHDKAVIEALVYALDTKHPFFAGHSRRVAGIASLIGSRLNLTREETVSLKYAALLHDVGKLHTLGDAAGEPGTGPQEHAVLGADILPEDDFFKPIKEAIASHHERYDGQGYPHGLVRNDIPFLARIITAADFYDALVRLCPPEQRLNHQQSLKAIKKATGTLFDPLVVVALEEVEENINKFYLNQPTRPDNRP
jgi:putative nucleotidyltransferase with HDIG domain